MGTLRLILGIGKSGFSVAKYWTQLGLKFSVMDTREAPPHLSLFKEKFPNVPLHIGGIQKDWICRAHMLILSPGIHPATLNLKTINPNLKIYSDIDLFSKVANAPIIAITGSNGKSTATTLTGHLLKAANKQVQVGGNLGIPALDLLREPPPDFYVLELSSFQLSITQSLRTHVSVFLNFSADHIDHHLSLEHYHASKQKIYKNSQIAVFNREDTATYPIYPISKAFSFGSSIPKAKEFGLTYYQGVPWLTQGTNPFFNTKSLHIKGQHNHLNSLAALSIIYALNIPLKQVLPALSNYKGLSHRFEWVTKKKGVTWINDSKATNTEAVLAALSSFSNESRGKLILIMGGVDKGADFNVLEPFLKKYVKQLVILGAAAVKLQKAFQKLVPLSRVTTLKEAVQLASNSAIGGDIVLLSPACASQDMFKDYAERGDYFKMYIQQLM